jgi:hypothetical protein
MMTTPEIQKMKISSWLGGALDWLSLKRIAAGPPAGRFGREDLSGTNCSNNHFENITHEAIPSDRPTRKA